MKTAHLIALLPLFLTAPLPAEEKPNLNEHPDRKDVAGIPGDDEEMIAAQERAAETLMTFVKAIQEPEDGKRYLVKVRLAEGDNVEHVWLEPVKWKDPGIIGVLAVKPIALEDHKQGDVISPLPDDITDWVILSPDGSKEGGFTADVVEKRRREAEEAKAERPK